MSNTYMTAYNFRPKRITVLMGKFMWMAIANSLDLIRYAPTFSDLGRYTRFCQGVLSKNQMMTWNKRKPIPNMKFSIAKNY